MIDDLVLSMVLLVNLSKKKIYKKVRWFSQILASECIYFSFEFTQVGMRFLVSFDEMMIIAPFVSEFIMIFAGYVYVSVSRKKIIIISKNSKL